MTDALTRLADAVEAGTIGQFRNLDSELGNGNGIHGKRAYNGSLDAAKALHEAVLPGWHVTSLCQLWDVTTSGEYIGIGNDWSIELHHSNGDVRPHGACATSNDPARAWLLAVIRAMAQVQG